MGLLDDAIRDHLDLKRRHGADASELEEAEREALGPVRRDPFEEDELAASAAGAPAYDYADDLHESEEEYEPAEAHGDTEAHGDAEAHEPAEAHGDAEGDRVDAFEEERVAEEPLAEHPAAAVLDDEPPVAEPTQVLGADELEEAVRDEPAVPRPHPAGAGAETVEYDVEEALEAEPRHPHEEEHAEPHDAEPAEHREGSDEDVLEETPEFLQDTPDHDRLWFEQRPPKDFDFDG